MAAACLVGAFGFLLIAAPSGWQAIQESRYLPVTAQAVYGSPIEVHSKFADYYALSVDYEYEVNGRTYKGNCALDHYPSERAAQDELQKMHREGRSFTVYYNPDQPGWAKTEEGKSGAMQFALTVLACATVLFLLSIPLIRASRNVDQ